jgi:hypothetical protein
MKTPNSATPNAHGPALGVGELEVGSPIVYSDLRKASSLALSELLSDWNAERELAA